MNFEKINSDKFKNYKIDESSLKNINGGSATGGGERNVGQMVVETYNSDTEHSNGGVSWQTSDFCQGELLDP